MVFEGSVATPLRCSGIFKKQLCCNLLLNLSVGEFKNWLAFGEVTNKSLSVQVFFGSQLYVYNDRLTTNLLLHFFFQLFLFASLYAYFVFYCHLY